MQQNYHAIDKLAMAVGGTLMLLGVVVLGFVEILGGEPYSAAPLMNDAGEIVATPLVDPNIRTGLVILGFLVLLLWGFYRMASPTTFEAGAKRDVAAPE